MAFLRSACPLLAIAHAAAIAVLRPVMPKNEEGDGLVYDPSFHAWANHKIADATAPPSPAGQKSGFELAKHWNECKHRLEYPSALSAHYIDSLASARHNFLFVDNVKAGSTSIRLLLEEQLGITWYSTDIPGAAEHTGQTGRQGVRYSSRDFDETSQMFKFSLVRDPVAKFESGVREARFQDPQHFEHMSADEVLEEVISTGVFTNEHLQPSSYRLSAFDARIPPSMVSLGFIGKIELLGGDWPEIVDNMQGIGEDQQKRMTQSLSRDNAREHEPSSLLTEAGIRRMCESPVYKLEWDCFDYELPPICRPGR